MADRSRTSDCSYKQRKVRKGFLSAVLATSTEKVKNETEP